MTLEGSLGSLPPPFRQGELAAPQQTTWGSGVVMNLMMTVTHHGGRQSLWQLSPIMAKRSEWYTALCLSLLWYRLGR